MEQELEGFVGASDPGARERWNKPAYTYQERDYADHRQVYVGIHMPIKSIPLHSRRVNGANTRTKHSVRHGHGIQRRRRQQVVTKQTDDSGSEEEVENIPPASERVKFILGGQPEENEEHDKHELFTELEEFITYEDGNEEWKETARWFKYEEDVEEGGDRWSKPHVATLSLYSLFEVRSCLMSGTVILDMEADSLSQIADLVLDHLVSCNKLEEVARVRVRDTLLRRHRHQRPAGLRRGLSNIISNKKCSHGQSGGEKTRKTSTSSMPPANGNKCTLENGGLSATLPSRNKQLDPMVHSSLSINTFPRQNSTTNSSAQLTRNESVQGHLVYQGPLPAVSEEADDKISGYMKKLPPNSEASNVLVGEVDFLTRPIAAFIRLQQSVVLGDLTEIPIPTRFLFIMMGPSCNPGKYHEVGRAVSTLMADEVFHDVAYRAKSREDLIAGIDEFLEQVTILPPGEWDPTIRIEPPPETPTNDGRRPGGDHRKAPDNTSVGGVRTVNSSNNSDEEDGITVKYWTRTKRPFGGLGRDFDAYKHRGRDIRDAFNLQCLGSVFFMYFVTLAVLVALGDLQQRDTRGQLGMRENLLALTIGGALYSWCSGQPLVLLCFTFPLVMFEKALHELCILANLDYLPFRMWIGLWTVMFLLIFLGFDLSIYIRYFTRFTLDTFIVLVGITLILQGLREIDHIRTEYPVVSTASTDHSCHCLTHNETALSANVSDIRIVPKEIEIVSKSIRDCVDRGGFLEGSGCNDSVYFFSVLLTLSTVVMVIGLAYLRATGFFPKMVRRTLADFATLIVVVLLSVVGCTYDVNLPFVSLPTTYNPLESDRKEWIVNFFGSNGIWTFVAAILPAVLLSLIIFLEQHMSGLLANRKENKLKKSAGYHLDLCVVTVTVLISSLLGLPFVTGSALITVNHLQSLYVGPTEHAKMRFKGVREQRCTGLLVAVLIGLSPQMTPALRCIPKPVLYGILIYAGLRTFLGVQFIQRLKVMMMARKNQPDLVYLRQIPILTAYLFTILQLISLCLLWPFRMTVAAVIFPFMVTILIVVRALMERLLPVEHLSVLDEMMHFSLFRKKPAQGDVETGLLEGEVETNIVDEDESDGVIIDMRNGLQTNTNISEELAKMPVWRQLMKSENSPSSTGTKESPKPTHAKRKRRRKQCRKKPENTFELEKEDPKRRSLFREEEIPPRPPWEEPYPSPPRADLKYLDIPECDVNVDPACSRSESKSASGDDGQVSQDAAAVLK